MKNRRIISFIYLALFAVLFSACAEDSASAPEEPVDTFDANVVCPAEGVNAYGEPNRGTFTDARDGQVYKYTTIGNQVWMAENLKFDAPYSLCYGKIDGFCDTFGRFYSLHEKGEDLGHFDQELLDTICPAGWRVPSVDEWSVLSNNMGGGKKVVPRLVSSMDFGENYAPGSDDCAFNALPAGYWLKNGDLSLEYIVSVYWTSTAMPVNSSYCSWFGSDGIGFALNHPKMSLRCVKN